MPLFDYECPNCGKTSEIRVVKYDDQPACPHCGATGLKKLPALFATGSTLPDCAHADACATAHNGGHHCCNGCCHH
ncbi:MAG: zinc ribbon domain-containing protein [Victivallales bacterium]|nr:zinc ribbon domain-containing protein [Victivallales bacterium]